MIRAVRIDLGHLTEKKRRMIREIYVQYRAAVNFYIRKLWRGENPRWNALLPHTRLGARYVSCAHHQARAIVRTARKAKAKKMPIFKGRPILDYRFVVHKTCGLRGFDRLLLLSTLKKGTRIAIPYKSHARLDYWLSRPGARLRPGCALSEREVILWVEIPDPPQREAGVKLGVDLGFNHLMATATGDLIDGKVETLPGELIGTELKRIYAKALRKKRGSKALLRTLRERNNLIGYFVNRLPWDRLSVLVVENLRYLKHGKKKNRGKSFRKALAHWTYRQVLARLCNKAQENGVLLVTVEPRNTSRECPVCGSVHKENRKGEMFCCVSCGHTAQADLVGARNILRKYLCGSAGSQCPRCHEVLAGGKSGDLLETAGNSGEDTPRPCARGTMRHLETAGNFGEDTPLFCSGDSSAHLETAGNFGEETPKRS